MTKSGKRERKKKKDSQLIIRISSEERDEFIALCEELDSSAAREIRRFIREFVQEQASQSADPAEGTTSAESQ